nr:unnamed protein product [Digitaria exilis]
MLTEEGSSTNVKILAMGRRIGERYAERPARARQQQAGACICICRTERRCPIPGPEGQRP